MWDELITLRLPILELTLHNICRFVNFQTFGRCTARDLSKQNWFTAEKIPNTVRLRLGNYIWATIGSRVELEIYDQAYKSNKTIKIVKKCLIFFSDCYIFTVDCRVNIIALADKNSIKELEHTKKISAFHDPRL